MSTAWRKASMSSWPLGPRNFIRLSEARLQAVSSRNMNSEHGFEALIRPVVLQVYQRLIVVSYCMPGAPQCQTDSAYRWASARAGDLPAGVPSVTLRGHPSRP